MVRLSIENMVCICRILSIWASNIVEMRWSQTWVLSELYGYLEIAKTISSATGFWATLFFWQVQVGTEACKTNQNMGWTVKILGFNGQKIWFSLWGNFEAWWLHRSDMKNIYGLCKPFFDGWWIVKFPAISMGRVFYRPHLGWNSSLSASCRHSAGQLPSLLRGALLPLSLPIPPTRSGQSMWHASCLLMRSAAHQKRTLTWRKWWRNEGFERRSWLQVCGLMRCTACACILAHYKLWPPVAFSARLWPDWQRICEE